MLRIAPPSFRPYILLALVASALLLSVDAHPQALDPSAVLKAVDASVTRREADLAGYTAIERYRVFRSADSTHPAAEMIVKTTYRKESGKNYQILSQSGSQLLRRELLQRMLDNERNVTRPSVRLHALIDTRNYKMKVASREMLANRPCILLNINPRKSAPYLFNGQIWVDARDGSIVQLQGTTSKPAVIIAGPTQVSRQYTMIDGYPMATHAAASSSIFLVGQIRIAIDYSDYHLQSAPAHSPSPLAAR